MKVSPIACPECSQPIKRLRSVPGRLGKILKFRLYECKGCNRIFESVEVVHRSELAAYTKRYISRIETSRLRLRKLELEAQKAKLESDDGSTKPAA